MDVLAAVVVIVVAVANIGFAVLVFIFVLDVLVSVVVVADVVVTVDIFFCSNQIRVLFAPLLLLSFSKAFSWRWKTTQCIFIFPFMLSRVSTHKSFIKHILPQETMWDRNKRRAKSNIKANLSQSFFPSPLLSSTSSSSPLRLMGFKSGFIRMLTESKCTNNTGLA